jgi:hypothetical protein
MFLFYLQDSVASDLSVASERQLDTEEVNVSKVIFKYQGISLKVSP